MGAKGNLELAAVSTYLNTADIGTKALADF